MSDIKVEEVERFKAEIDRLKAAILRDDVGYVRCMLDFKNDVLTLDEIDKQILFDDVSHTALTYACKNGSSSVVQFLVQAGANVLEKNGREKTPLYFACLGCSSLTVGLLIEADPTAVNMRNGPGEDTPLMCACELDEPPYASVERLLQAGADLTMKNSGGQTALFAACDEEKIDLLKVLLTHATPEVVNAKQEGGWTLLMLASKMGNLDLVKMLLNAGSDLTCKNDDGHTAMDIAVEYEQVDVCKYYDIAERVQTFNSSFRKITTDFLDKTAKKLNNKSSLDDLQKVFKAFKRDQRICFEDVLSACGISEDASEKKGKKAKREVLEAAAPSRKRSKK